MIFSNQHQPVEGRQPPTRATDILGLSATDWLLGALVPPVLMGLLASRAIAEGLTQVGLMSEQLWQGQRLPSLNIHPINPDGP